MTDISATPADLKPGVRVKCICVYHIPGFTRTGKTATIVNSWPLEVDWDDGYEYDRYWTFASNFSVIAAEATTTAGVPAPNATPIPPPEPALPAAAPFDFDSYNQLPISKRKQT